MGHRCSKVALDRAICGHLNIDFQLLELELSTALIVTMGTPKKMVRSKECRGVGEASKQASKEGRKEGGSKSGESLPHHHVMMESTIFVMS